MKAAVQAVAVNPPHYLQLLLQQLQFFPRPCRLFSFFVAMPSKHRQAMNLPSSSRTTYLATGMFVACRP